MSALSVLCRGLKLNRQQLPTIGGKGVAVAASASGNTSESPGKGNNEKRERRAEHSNKLEDCDVEDDHHSDSALSTDETDDECDKARNEDAGDGPTAANTVHRFCVKAGELRAMRKRDCTGPEPLATLDDLRSHLPASLFGTLGLVFHIKDLTLIQKHALPWGFAKRSFFGCAPTGSGKTLAYLLPIVLELLAAFAIPTCKPNEIPALLAASGSSESPNKKRRRDAENGKRKEKGKRGASGPNLRHVIIAPTRELAQQVLLQFELLTTDLDSHIPNSSNTDNKTPSPKPQRPFACGLLEKRSGKVNAQPSREASTSSKEDVDGVAWARELVVAVATPGFSALIKRGEVFEGLLAAVESVVFDEVDALIGASFDADCDVLIGGCRGLLPKKSTAGSAAGRPGEEGEKGEKRLRVVMFSATLSQKVLSVAENFIPDLQIIQIGTLSAACTDIEQTLVNAGHESGKMLLLKEYLATGELPPMSLLFTQDKGRARTLAMQMSKWRFYGGGAERGAASELGARVSYLSSGVTSEERAQRLHDFRTGKIWFLICTDVLARGIDCYGVSKVLNFDFPTTRQNYIHRIGRTGRSGRAGKAVTFFTEADVVNLPLVTSVMRQSQQPVPTAIESLAAGSKSSKWKDGRKQRIRNRNLERRPPKRRPLCHLAAEGDE